MNKLLIVLLCLPIIGFGQGWEKTFGGTDGISGGASVQQTTDGGYIITGHTTESNKDIYLIKTDSNGDSLWTRTFGEAGSDGGGSVQQTTDGGYIITGFTWSFGQGMTSDVFLIKTDGNGDSLWIKTFGGINFDIGTSVQQTTDGGYIIAGRTESFGQGEDVYLIKTDGNGNSLWTRTFDAGNGDQGWSVQQTNDGGYIIAGRTWPFAFGLSADVWLIKTDGNGDSLWTKTFGGGDDEVASSVQQTTDGGYIITGLIGSFGGNGNSLFDVYLLKTDGNGDSLWTKTFGGTNTDDQGSDVQQTIDGGYIITGSTESFGNGGYDVYLIKTDGNGDSLWTKTFGGGNDDSGWSVQQTTDGGYIITGETEYFGNGMTEVYLIKTDVNGNVTSTFNIPMPSNRELKKVVDILGRDINPEKNKPFIEIYNDGTVEKKIIIE